MEILKKYILSIASVLFILLILIFSIDFMSLPLQYNLEYSNEFLNIWNNSNLTERSLDKYINILLLSLKKIFIYFLISFNFLLMITLITFYKEKEAINTNVLDGLVEISVLPAVIYGLMTLLPLNLFSAIFLSLVLSILLLFSDKFFNSEQDRFENIIGIGIIFSMPLIYLSNFLFSLEYFISFIVISSIFFLKLYSYPYHFFKGHHSELDDNPYLSNKNIFSSFDNLGKKAFFSLSLIDRKLIKEAKENPTKGYDFSTFLYSNRKDNLYLGSLIRHASFAGQLLYHPLKDNTLITLKISSDTETLIPSTDWFDIIKKLKRQIIAYEGESHISLKKEHFEELIQLISKLKKQNDIESYNWNYLYEDSIQKWLDESAKVLKNLELKQQGIEPIQKNIYRHGLALQPNRDEDIFLGREDVKKELSIKVLTSANVPALMIQGQRRVGKTSFINFLSELLGSRFKVAVFDCQGVESQDFSILLRQVKEKVDRVLNLNTDINFTGDWVEDWNLFENYLNNIVLDDNIKLLIVLDEYEVIHEIFQKKHKKAAFILGRMRSFLQHQNNISFIFVGLYTFDDLTQPNWSEYFVHYERFKIKYLNKKDTIKLITHPIENFNLKYNKDVANELYNLTQGHPTLVQLICSHIVNNANKIPTSTVTMKMLKDVVENIVSDKGLSPTQLFWKQLCNAQDKKSIRLILEGKEVMDKKSLYKLEDYGFLENGKIRVPIFEIWLRKFHEIVV